jgi:hypothetical protein
LGKNQRPQIVQSRHMIHVFVREHHSVEASVLGAKHLLPKIRTTVNQHFSVWRRNQNRCP